MANPVVISFRAAYAQAVLGFRILQAQARRTANDIAQQFRRASAAMQGRWTSATAAMRRALSAVGGVISRLGPKLGELAGNLREGAAGFAALASKALAMVTVGVHLVPTVVDLLGVITLMPAAILAAGVAFATLKLATSGIGDHISAALEDWNEWEKTTKKMPRSMHDFVAAIVLIRDKLKPLRRELQHRLFGGLGADLMQLTAVHLPSLNRWMPRISDHFNHGARAVLDWLKQGEQAATVEGIMRNVSTATGHLTRLLKPLAQIFTDIAAVAAPRLSSITETFANLIDKAAEWIRKMRESGKMGEWLDRSIDGFTELRGIAADLIGTIGAVYDAADDGGQTFLEGLHEQTTALKEWAKSAAGEQAIRGLSDLGKVILTLGGAVAQAFIGIVYVVQAIYRAFNSFLSFVLDVLSGILAAAAKAFSWIPGIGPKLAQASKEFDAYRDRVNKALAGIKDETVVVNIVTVERKMFGGTLGGSGGYRGFASGGLATGVVRVAERGAELVDLGPRGGRIRNAGDTRRLADGQDAGSARGDGGWVPAGAGNSLGIAASAMNDLLRYMFNGPVKAYAGGQRVRIA